MNKYSFLIFLPIFLILFIAACEKNVFSSQCTVLENDPRDFCILNSTIISDRVSDCSQIVNPQIKDLCYLKVSAKKNNTEICSDVKIPRNIDLCYFGIAAQTKNPAICDNIPEKVSENDGNSSISSTSSTYSRKLCIKVASLKEENPKYSDEQDNYISAEDLKTIYYRTTIAQDELMDELVNEEMEK